MGAIETITGKHWLILVGDVFAGLAKLADKSVHCCVVSPPYWGLRNYGFEGQIGLEKTPEEYIDAIVRVFREVRRVLRDDGVLFVNLGDSYAKDSKYGGTSGSKHQPVADAGAINRDYRASGLPNGNLVGIPWRVAFALQADGWILRQNIIWDKPAPMPESIRGTRWVRCRVKTSEPLPTAKHRKGDPSTVDGYRQTTDGAKYVVCPGCKKCRDHGGMKLQRGSWRPTTSHEFVFQLVKSQRYFADGDGSKEKASGTAHSRGSGINPKAIGDGLSRQNASYSSVVSGLVETRNIRSVWRLSPEGFKGAHFATYPTELVRRCLVAATSRGGCCSACGAQYAPVVESKRTATRPGTNSKVNRASDDDDSPYHQHSGDVVGNRDPKRHTTTTVVTGYLPACRCDAPSTRPVVLDVFSGSGTTGQVAINMGCDYIGLEGNPDYVQLQIKRLETPWVPRSERKNLKAGKRKRRASDSRQREMF